MITAKLADGTTLTFPDGTSDEVVDRVVKQHIQGGASTQVEAPPEPKPKRWQDLTPEEAQARMAGVLPKTGERVQNQIGARPDAPLGEAFGHLATAAPLVVSGPAAGAARGLIGRAARGAATAVGIGGVSDAASAISTGNPTELTDVVTKAPGRAVTGALLGPLLGSLAQRSETIAKLIASNQTAARIADKVIGPTTKKVAERLGVKEAEKVGHTVTGTIGQDKLVDTLTRHYAKFALDPSKVRWVTLAEHTAKNKR